MTRLSPQQVWFLTRVEGTWTTPAWAMANGNRARTAASLISAGLLEVDKLGGNLRVTEKGTTALVLAESKKHPKPSCPDECEKSPTGFCKYDVELDPSNDDCLWCGEPKERK